MRLLHTMLRVGDMQRSIDFYTKVLGMRLLRSKTIPTANSRWPSSATKTKKTAP